MMVISVVLAALGTLFKGLERRVMELEIRRIEIIQTTALLDQLVYLEESRKLAVVHVSVKKKNTSYNWIIMIIRIYNFFQHRKMYSVV